MVYRGCFECLLRHRWEELPNAGIVGTFVVLFLSVGIGEETGWRRFLQDHLQKRHSALAAALFVGLAWIFWHMPLVFFDEYFMRLIASPGMLMNWCMFVFTMAILLAWLYNSTNHSLLIPCLFHAMIDLTSGSLAAREPVSMMLWGIGLALTTVLALVLATPKTLAGKEVTFA